MTSRRWIAAAALLVACESSRAPPADVRRLACGEGRTLQVVTSDAHGNSFAVCVDQAGRYDGPTIGAQVRGEMRVEVRGQFEHEVPSGSWVCTRTPGLERLEFDVDPDRWAVVMWGVKRETLGRMSSDSHLAPPPPNLCPREDWARLARDGFVIDSLRHLGDLTRAGVLARVRHTPAP